MESMSPKIKILFYIKFIENGREELFEIEPIQNLIALRDGILKKLFLKGSTLLLGGRGSIQYFFRVNLWLSILKYAYFM